MSKARIDRLGFTMVELLAVIFIISILIGLAVGLSSYAGAKSDQAKAKAGIDKLQNAINEYHAEFGQVPDYQGRVNVSAFSGTYYSALQPYGGPSLVDPWGNGYVYSNSSRFAFNIYSTGPDTSDPSDDIGSRVTDN